MFARFRARLRDAPAIDDEGAAGDHLLNPAFRDDAGVALRDAAVLVPIIAHPAPTVLLTQRTGHLPSHAGQIAFPGGKIDRDDSSPAAAALRETEEEVGLRPAPEAVMGYLDTYLSRTGYRIVPVVARIEPGFKLNLNREEVDDAFEVPLDFLLEKGNFHRGTKSFGSTTAQFYEIPFGQRYIWGVTAGILRTLFDRMVD